MSYPLRSRVNDDVIKFAFDDVFIKASYVSSFRMTHKKAEYEYFQTTVESVEVFKHQL